MRFPRLAFLCVFLSLWLAAAAWGEVAIPALTARVTDLTNTLSEAQRTALEGELRLVEEKHGGNQIAVLLVPTTQPETIDQYALRVVETWKLGQKGVDNGLLLLVAKQDRKMRIEVGYGLEGVIPDAIAKRVISETITPLFKQGDFSGGLMAGVRQIGTLLDAEPLPETKQSSGGQSVGDSIGTLPIWLWVVLAVVGIVLRWFLGPLFGGLAMGSAVAGGAWFLSGSVLVAIFGGIAAFVLILVGAANWLGFALGSSFGSGGNGSSGGSDFSGGGGDFGGGGASGDW